MYGLEADVCLGWMRDSAPLLIYAHTVFPTQCKEGVIEDEFDERFAYQTWSMCIPIGLSMERYVPSTTKGSLPA